MEELASSEFLHFILASDILELNTDYCLGIAESVFGFGNFLIY